MTVGLLVSPTSEQEMLVDTTAKFIGDALPLAQVRQLTEQNSSPEPAYYAQAGALGWFAMLLDEQHGDGSTIATGLVEAAAMAAERGAALQPGPFVGANVVAFALSASAPPQHAELLGRLAEGQAMATWVFPDTFTTCLDGGMLVLDGTADWVSDASACEALLVTAEGPQGMTQVIVATDAEGVTVRQIGGLDITRTACRVALSGVRLEATQVVGTPGASTEQLVARQVQVAAVLSAAETVGAMHRNFEIALDYSKVRIAFGRPIGSFQAIKHLLADSALTLEMAKGIVAAAAQAVGSGEPGAAELAHSAKAFVAQRSIDLTHACFQVFGGIGYTWEHDHHLFMRRIASEAQSFGSAEWHRQRLSEQIGAT